MKIFNLIFALLFLLSAALQYNDPDPYFWMPIYLYGAALSWLAFRNKFYKKAYLIGIGIYAVYAFYLFTNQDGVLDWIKNHSSENIAGEMKANSPWIENTREFFGLMILIAVLGTNYFYAKKKRK